MGGCSGSRVRLVALVLVGIAALTGALAPGASAHPSDPTVRTVLDRVEPTLARVTVQVVENVAAQLVVENPTEDVLAVLDERGRPFLRIGPGGVEANLTSPSFWLSNSPSGGASVPPDASVEAAPRWARVATDPAWGWYDHRLHPDAQAVPPEVFEGDERATLAGWVVPLEYGGRPAEVHGHVEFTPVRGQVVARLLAADGPLPGVQAQLAAGRVPALFVTNAGPEPVVVLGPDEEPFARIGPAGAEVNRHSPLWIDNARANDQDVSALVADPSAAPDWVAVSSSPSLTWLDPRAAFPDPEPPADVVDAGEPAVLTEWSVPIEQAGTRVELAGETAWQPIAATAGDSDSGGDGVPAWALALAVLVPVALVAGGLATRRWAVARRR